MLQPVYSRRFASVELILTVLCGAVWVIKPEWGFWFILIALLPLAWRVASGGFIFRPPDWLVLVFAVTAWVGYWAAYDQATAWNKAWLIVTAVLLYFSLRAQPRQNLFPISVFIFFTGVGIALYYFLTHDFVAVPRKLEFVNLAGRWIMDVRPQTRWIPIHPNYVAGMIALTLPFALYPVWDARQRHVPIPAWLAVATMSGLGIALLALVMATSRGVVLAVLGGAGGWFLWRSIHWIRNRFRLGSEAFFPILLMAYLCAVVVFLYAGPARMGGLFSGSYYYGDGSRAELFSRSVYLLFDYPITGGGLGSFPGLYSQYLLNIPFFNVPNSHNLFLDVGIEQGIFGGVSFLLLYLLSVWRLSWAMAGTSGDRVFEWIVLFALIAAIAHGMVDDYLYNGAGTMLSLFLVGLGMNDLDGGKVAPRSRFDLRTVATITIIWALVGLVNFNQVRAIWHANVGAVQLAKAELTGFPNVGWAGAEIVPRLDAAEASLRASLQFDPANRTANQRLGMISIYRRDFESAVMYFEAAHARAPEHRGIIKSLAYSYIWLGDMEKAQTHLSEIPEAVEELDVYIRWWEAQGRDDLSSNASLALDALLTASLQP